MLKLKLLIFVENGNLFSYLISHVSRFFYSFLKRAPHSKFVSHVILHEIFRAVYQNLS